MTQVLGRPVTGEITKPSRTSMEQWPGEKFLPLLDVLLNIEGVHSVSWHQYTPYFNDGDPCLFSVGEIYVKMIDGDEEAGDYEDGYLDTSDMVTYPAGYRNPPTINSGFEELYPALRELGQSMGHFENFLQDAFGDHARIVATREGFDVEFYEHG